MRVYITEHTIKVYTKNGMRNTPKRDKQKLAADAMRKFINHIELIWVN